MGATPRVVACGLMLGKSFFVMNFTESLILAQDERWRRA